MNISAVSQLASATKVNTTYGTSHSTLATSNLITQDSTHVSISVEARLAEIKRKDAVSRTDADTAFLFANDKKLAEISAQGKSPDQLTSSELDYMQKSLGFVNTMANLSPAEKSLYDQAIASGNTEAAQGLAQIAFIRTGGQMAGGANGTTYDPTNTAITAENIEKYFSHSIIDSTGNANTKFQALIQFLHKNTNV